MTGTKTFSQKILPFSLLQINMGVLLQLQDAVLKASLFLGGTGKKFPEIFPSKFYLKVSLNLAPNILILREKKSGNLTFCNIDVMMIMRK